MSAIFFVLMVIAMAAVLASLFIGVAGMAKGGKFNSKYGNKLMQARVYLQAGAVAFFILSMLTIKK